MKNNIFYTILGVSLILSLAGCEYDNYDEPDALLTGTLVYEGNPIGLRTNASVLELWQDGYELNQSIPVHIAQDGTYSVFLFDGEYKMVVKEGGPYVPQVNDTIIVQVDGNTTYDVSVTPYVTVSDVNYQIVGDSVTAQFRVDTIADGAELAEVRLYIGESILTDQNRNEFAESLDVANLTIGEQTTFTVGIPEGLLNEGYLFFRMGARANQSGEFYYSSVQKIDF